MEAILTARESAHANRGLLIFRRVFEMGVQVIQCTMTWLE